MRSGIKLIIVLILSMNFFNFCLADRLEVVVIKDGNVRSGPGTHHKKIGRVSMGDSFWLKEMQKGWYKIKLDHKYGWVSSLIAVAENDSAYTNQLLILRNQAVKDGGKGVGYVKRGQIVRLLRKGDIQQIIEVNGIRGFVKTGDTKQIGPSTFPMDLKDRILNQKGMVFDVFHRVDEMGQENIYLYFLKWIIALAIPAVVFFICFYFVSKMVNILARIKFLSNKVILVLMGILLFFPVMDMFLFFISTPPFESIWFGLLFPVIWFSQLTYQREKLYQNRCKKCRKMWATVEKGTVFLGKFVSVITRTTYFKNRRTQERYLDSSSTTERTYLAYKDLRECKFCKYQWSIFRSETLNRQVLSSYRRDKY